MESLNPWSDRIFVVYTRNFLWFWILFLNRLALANTGYPWVFNRFQFLYPFSIDHPLFYFDLRKYGRLDNRHIIFCCRGFKCRCQRLDKSKKRLVYP